MQSAFTKKRGNAQATAAPATEETYNLLGLNLREPDEDMPAGESPWAINARAYARNDGESRVAIRTRMGAGLLATPVGETLNTQNIAAVGPGIYAFGTLGDGSFRRLAMPFTPSTTGPITRADIEMDNQDVVASGHVIIEVHPDRGGFPDPTITLAQGSVLGNALTTSMQFLPAYFIDAPALTSGTQYWLVWYMQDNSTFAYYSNESTGTSGKASADGGNSWGASTGNFRFKTYISTAGGIRGYTTRYPSNAANNLIMFAQNDKIYTIPKAGGTPTQIDSGLDNTSNPLRFVQFQDQTLYVAANGGNHARYFDGTTVADIGGSFPTLVPFNLIVWQNRLFVMSANNRVDFSDINLPNSFTSTNFFYVPAPLSADHMTGWQEFQDRLVIFTHKTKHVIIGSDISTFTRKEAEGTQGCVSQEAMDKDHNYIYFMAPDKQIYAFNGITDVLISEKVQSRLGGISDVSKVRIQVYRNQLRVYYPHGTAASNNEMLLYDLEQKQWVMDTGHQVTGSAALSLDNNELLEFSNLVGRVMYGEVQYSDLGKALDWQYWTPYKTYAYRRRNGQTFGGGSAKKRIKRFRPVVRITESSFNMLVGKDMDFANQPDMREYLVDGGGAKWGSFDWGDGTVYGGRNQINNKSGMSGRGQYIQYRFQRLGVETPVELYGYIAQYKMGKQR